MLQLSAVAKSSRHSPVLATFRPCERVSPARRCSVRVSGRLLYRWSGRVPRAVLRPPTCASACLHDRVCRTRLKTTWAYSFAVAQDPEGLPAAAQVTPGQPHCIRNATLAQRSQVRMWLLDHKGRQCTESCAFCLHVILDVKVTCWPPLQTAPMMFQMRASQHLGSCAMTMPGFAPGCLVLHEALWTLNRCWWSLVKARLKDVLGLCSRTW